MKAFGAIILTILTSLFFFPFNSSLLPSVNTKLALSIVGLLLLGFQGFKIRGGQLNRTLTSVSLWALAVSVVGVISVIVNNTTDFTFATYLISVWVWLAASYVVLKTIYFFYGKVNLRIVANFLIAVCVLQCIISQLTDNNETIATWVKSFVVSEGFMGIPKGRLYGIGCALDVAGLKFCTVLILLSYFAAKPSGKINKYLESSIYIFSFAIIAIFGSMIARTTAVGIGIAITLWFIYPFIYKDKSDYNIFCKSFFFLLLIFIPVGIYLYRTNPGFHTNLRFGFEGLFSLVEQGEWNVRSNDMMMSMWVWPDNLKTWIIGDGYFNSPRLNPFYVGPDFIDFYMGTDLGYCRYIFYFGLVGLLTFICFFTNCAYQCSRNMPHYTILFWAILAINLIGWCKVSSDIFPIFALLLWINPAEDKISLSSSLSLHASV